MANPRHDYASQEFLDKIEGFAKKGYTDKEIAYEIDLTPNHFSELKSEHDHISEALARGRAKINNIVRQRFLAVGLGGIKIKSVTKQKSKYADAIPGDDDMVVHETETELAPNLSALATWLFNHDEEWREKTIEGKRIDVTSKGEKVNTDPVVFVSASELDDDVLQKMIKQQTGESEIDGDSSNNTGS